MLGAAAAGPARMPKRRMGPLMLGRIGCLVLLVTLATLAVVAAPRPAAAQRFKATATTAMIGDIVAGLAGDAGEVTTLLGPGVDPHLYKLTRADLAKLLGA